MRHLYFFGCLKKNTHTHTHLEVASAQVTAPDHVEHPSGGPGNHLFRRKSADIKEQVVVNQRIVHSHMQTTNFTAVADHRRSKLDMKYSCCNTKAYVLCFIETLRRLKQKQSQNQTKSNTGEPQVAHGHPTKMNGENDTNSR